MYKTTAFLMLICGAATTSPAFAQAADNGVPNDTAVEAARSAALERQYADLEAELRTLQERLAIVTRDYAAVSGALPVRALPSGDRRTAIAENEAMLARLADELRVLRQRYTHAHPRVQLAERQLEAAEARLAALRAAEAADRRSRSLEAPVRPAEGVGPARPRQAPVDTASVDRPPGGEGDERPAAERDDAQNVAALRAAIERSMAQFRNTPRYPSTTVWDAMQLVALTPQLGEYFGTESGILVLRAPENESLGLRDGDVILDIGGRVPTTPEHTLRILSSFVPGETLTLGIMRNGRRETREIALPAVEVDGVPAATSGGTPDGARSQPSAATPETPSPSPPPSPPAAAGQVF
jgi:hypothetical protein